MDGSNAREGPQDSAPGISSRAPWERDGGRLHPREASSRRGTAEGLATHEIDTRRGVDREAQGPKETPILFMALGGTPKCFRKANPKWLTFV